MSYRIEIMPRLHRVLAAVGLSDFVKTEVYRRLTDDLQADPWQLLHRQPNPTEGMAYAFDFVDPENRIVMHAFLFRVVYGQDEETLQIPYGRYARIVVL